MAKHTPILPPILDTEPTTATPPEARPVQMFHGPGDPHLGYGYDQPREQRYDGWTPEKQRVFLEALSEGHTVTYACRAVRMSQQSAYALRRSARGAAFALGWQAALLLGRDRLADEMMDRALNGTVEEISLGNGQVTERRRFDNRLGMAMLARLDRMMGDTGHGAEAGAAHGAARLVAQDFEQYLELVGRDAGPARAGVFLGARIEGGAAKPANENDLAPLRALARADTWLRTHTDLAEGVDTADLLPDDRKDWTAEQWRRAEAAGLVALAPNAKPAGEEEAPESDTKLHQPLEYIPPSQQPDPVWWSGRHDAWRTRFPPPPDFDGEEVGEFGDEDYSRALTWQEKAFMDEPWLEEVAEREAKESLERDAWFGFTPESLDEEDEDEDWDDDEDEDEDEDDGEDDEDGVVEHEADAPA